MKILENRVPPPLLVLFILPLMWATQFVQAPIDLEPHLHFVLRVLTGVFALAVGMSGIFAFRRAKTTINPVQIDQASQLVTGGIYRLTRNPMYVGLTGLLTMYAIHLTVPIAMLGPILFAVFIHFFQILPEERTMASKFGSEYLEYKRRVRRWL